MNIQIGDIVAIRGDLRVRMNNRLCCYLPNQLVLGKYLKHTGNGRIWTGIVKKIDGDMALVAGGWRGIERYEVIVYGSPRAI